MDKYPIYETSMTQIKRNEFGYIEYKIITTYYNDGSTEDREVPGRLHYIKPIDVGGFDFYKNKVSDK